MCGVTRVDHCWSIQFLTHSLGSTTLAVVILVSDDESNVNQHIQPVHGTLFGKGLSNSPTFVVCLDDSSFAKGKEIQQKVGLTGSRFLTLTHVTL